jgi:hypothetical protein
MKMPPLEPSNLLRHALLATERIREWTGAGKPRKGDPSPGTRSSRSDSAPPPPRRDVDRPPQIW